MTRWVVCGLPHSFSSLNFCPLPFPLNSTFTLFPQEVSDQWGLYDGHSEQLASALRLRPCRGYHLPAMTVIPPGLDFSNLKVKVSPLPALTSQTSR